MAMSKRDYAAIAAAVNSTRYTLDPEIAGEDERTRAAINCACAELAGKIATYCAADNPRFDRRRFLEACGLDKT